MSSPIRTRSSNSTSSTGNRLSFGGSMRLTDLLDDSDEYGLRLRRSPSATTDVEVEEATELDQRLSASVPDENMLLAGGERDSQRLSAEADSISHASTSTSQSQDSKELKETSKFGLFLDKAKAKTKKIVSSGKDKKCREVIDEASQCKIPAMRTEIISDVFSEAKVEIVNELAPESLAKRLSKFETLPFKQYRLIAVFCLLAFSIAFPGFLAGLFWGLFISFNGFLYLFVSEPKTSQRIRNNSSRSEDAVDEAAEAVVEDDENANGFGFGNSITYRGWMNELRSHYSPMTYNVNQSQCVLVRLEGSTLRISRPAKAVLKHAFHEDPTLKSMQHSIVSQAIYELTDAKVSLRPKRLARRRWWSRKYPIHIRFSHKTNALAEVDLSRAAMTRSVSMHPTDANGRILPVLSDLQGTVDEGYSADSDISDSEDSVCAAQSSIAGEMIRSSSSGDIVEYQARAEGTSRKRPGRSIYLFVRAAREKERWFHLLREATAATRSGRKSKEYVRSASEELKTSTNEALQNGTAPSLTPAMERIAYQCNHAQFIKQLIEMLGRRCAAPEPGSTVSIDLGTMRWRPGVVEENSGLLESINAFGTRIFFDLCRDPFWAEQVKAKIQSKLATIHLPYFIEKLELSHLSLGTVAPQIMGVYSPKVDEWGIWVDFEMKYLGGIRLVLQTSVNLLKLKSDAAQKEKERQISAWTKSVRTSRFSDEDLPESPESSPDEDFGSKNNSEGTVREKTGKKLLSMFERATQSSLFQKAAKLPKVAKLIEDISSTSLMLNVEVELLEGAMTLNLPPPPSDRLWYSFRQVPQMNLRAVPQVGDRSVDLTTVSDWIEAKLRLLIEKNLVCPNMDDIELPVMRGNNLLQMGYNM